jgi:hypothetical protein
MVSNKQKKSHNNLHLEVLKLYNDDDPFDKIHGLMMKNDFDYYFDRNHLDEKNGLNVDFLFRSDIGR